MFFIYSVYTSVNDFSQKKNYYILLKLQKLGMDEMEKFTAHCLMSFM